MKQTAVRVLNDRTTAVLRRCRRRPAGDGALGGVREKPLEKQGVSADAVFAGLSAVAGRFVP